MLLLALELMLAAAPVEKPVSLASPGFSYAQVPEQMATFCADHFAQQLTLEGVRVTTPSEIGALIGLERTKQLLGCADDSTNCIVELANALGVDGIVTGSIGRFGKSWVVNIKVISNE